MLTFIIVTGNGLIYFYCLFLLTHPLKNRSMRHAYMLFSLVLLAYTPAGGQEMPLSIKSGGIPFVSFEERQQRSLRGRPDTPTPAISDRPSSFRDAAGRVTPAVVHILSAYKPGFGGGAINPFSEFYNDNLQPNSLTGSASGVIISDDGYLVTNYHVVKEAVSLKVILQDQRSFQAEVIGGDSLTDLALLKLPAHQLPFVVFGSTDSVDVGDWALAVGNPLNLSSTVTAGIISAKSRSISALEEEGGIFSFIQTDAVMNSGNSGGALTDANGRLIGINTGILTQTGIYSGYSFSIPVEVVKKVCNDLLRYGRAERGYIGLYLKNLPEGKGVYVDSLVKNGAADRCGIQQDDIVIKIDERPAETVAAFHEIMILHRPGDKVTVTLLRKGKQIRVAVLLSSQEDVMGLLYRNKASLPPGTESRDTN
jgi:serine protease Do